MSAVVWTLQSYADVHAALRSDCLAPYGVQRRGDGTHEVVRRGVALEMPPALLNVWRVALSARADALLLTLPTDATVDLVTDFAVPWARDAAQLALALSPDIVDDCMPMARTIAGEAAIARSGAPSDVLAQAAARLSAQLGAFGGASLVQSFVALTHTVPALIASALLALLQHPEQLAWLRAQLAESMLANATNELLRYAGPSRAVFRTAVAPVSLGDVAINTGDEVVLLLAQANRDPTRFVDPDQFDLQRNATGHLAFGSGPHGCAGATIVRMLLHEAIAAFVRAPRVFTLDHPASGVTWLDGFSLRAPRTLPAVVRERSVSSNASQAVSGENAVDRSEGE